MHRQPPPNRKRQPRPPQAPGSRRQQPEGDQRPAWWRQLASTLDLPGRLAEHMEARWQRWWVPLILLSFPILLLLLAFVVRALR